MKSVRFIIEYIFFIFFLKFFYILPYSISIFLGKFIAKLGYIIDKKHREIAYNNLKQSFPQKNEKEISKIVKNVFTNIVKSFIEFAYLSGKKREIILNRVKIEGIENFYNAKNKGKGTILIISHFGNWELIGAIFPRFSSSYAVVFPQSNPLTDKVINDIRRKSGLNIIYTGHTKKIFEALKSDSCVGFLADQDAGNNGIFVDFLSHPASTHTGPVRIAMKTSSPIVVCIIIREKDDTHRMIITPEIHLTTSGNEEENIKNNTQKWVSIIEEYIVKYPEQWFWVHRRWKTKPSQSSY